MAATDPIDELEEIVVDPSLYMRTNFDEQTGGALQSWNDAFSAGLNSEAFSPTYYDPSLIYETSPDGVSRIIDPDYSQAGSSAGSYVDPIGGDNLAEVVIGGSTYSPFSMEQIQDFLADPNAQTLFGTSGDSITDTLNRLSDQYGVEQTDIIPRSTWGSSVADSIKEMGQVPFENLLSILIGAKRVNASEDWIQENITGPFGRLLGSGFDALTKPLQDLFGAAKDRMSSTGESFEEAIDSLKYNGIFDSLLGDRPASDEDLSALEEISVEAKRTTDPGYADFVNSMREQAGYGFIPGYEINLPGSTVSLEGTAAAEEPLEEVTVTGEAERQALDQLVQNALNPFNVTTAGTGAELRGAGGGGSGDVTVGEDGLEEVSVTGTAEQAALDEMTRRYLEGENQLNVTTAGTGVGAGGSGGDTSADVTTGEDGLEEVTVTSSAEQQVLDDLTRRYLEGQNQFNVTTAGTGVGFGGAGDDNSGDVTIGEDGLEEVTVTGSAEQQALDDMTRRYLEGQNQFNVTTAGTGVGGYSEDAGAADNMEEVTVSSSREQAEPEPVISQVTMPATTISMPAATYSIADADTSTTAEDTTTSDEIRQMQQQADTAATATTTAQAGSSRMDPRLPFNPQINTGLPTPGELYRNLGRRDIDMSMEDWLTYGQRPELSFYNYVPIRDETLPGYPRSPGPAADQTPPAEQRMAYGGMAMGGSQFAVRGMGDGRADKIPAMLSDGEYVIDAETVALLGNGSSEAGAKALDRFRVNVRKHKGKELSRGKFSVKAKSPEAYLGGRV